MNPMHMFSLRGKLAVHKTPYSSGDSQTHRGVLGCCLLTNVSVAAEVNRRIGEYRRTAGLTLVWLLELAKRAVSADFRDDDR